MGVPAQPLLIGVTVMVALMRLDPLLVAVKEGTLPVPDAAKPMAGLEFVQLKLTPAGVPEGLNAGMVVPSVTEISVVGFTVATGERLR